MKLGSSKMVCWYPIALEVDLIYFLFKFLIVLLCPYTSSQSVQIFLQIKKMLKLYSFIFLIRTGKMAALVLGVFLLYSSPSISISRLLDFVEWVKWKMDWKEKIIWKSFFSVPMWCSSTFHQFLGFGVFIVSPTPSAALRMSGACSSLLHEVFYGCHMIRAGTVHLIPILVPLVHTASYWSHYHSANDGDSWKTIKHGRCSCLKIWKTRLSAGVR